MKAHVAALCAALLAFAPARAADPAREIHGAADAFAHPGIAIAWGVLRAPKEDATAVVMRILPDTAVYAWVEIIGRDPFTQREATLFPAAEVAGAFDVRVPRTQFADFPRTEIRLWHRGSPPPAPPALAVFFAGVPDTTPEVADAGALDRSLATRITRAREDLRRRAP